MVDGRKFIFAYTSRVIGLATETFSVASNDEFM